jgi:hypothetical protein
MLYACKKSVASYGQLDKSVFHGTKLNFAVWMGQFCPSPHVLGQIKFKHATPHNAQANLQTAGAEWTFSSFRNNDIFNVFLLTANRLAHEDKIPDVPVLPRTFTVLVY